MNPDPRVVRELLDYDSSTGVMTWRKRGREWFKRERDCNAWNARYAGKRAGRVWTNKKYGYQCRMIAMLGSRLLEHHLAWLWMKGDPLPEQIDHRNRNSTDNRWNNLRPSTRIMNARNHSLQSNNTSGAAGVIWSKRDNKWLARCVINRKCRHIGLFDDIDDAARAVREFRSRHGFDPSHGMEPPHYRNQETP
ncbi:hypothetical protein EQG41_18075 [Billgrantia azerbaijanica]|nr:hypothetical protein EQG41_18075 [Halomonas azerbaijanica]